MGNGAALKRQCSRPSSTLPAIGQMSVSAHRKASAPFSEPLPRQPDDLAPRSSARDLLWALFKRQPRCLQATTATRPDYVGEGLARSFTKGSVIKSTQTPDDCFHQRTTSQSVLPGQSALRKGGIVEPRAELPGGEERHG
jgi:hypothetical protein